MLPEKPVRGWETWDGEGEKGRQQSGPGRALVVGWSILISQGTLMLFMHPNWSPFETGALGFHPCPPVSHWQEPSCGTDSQALATLWGVLAEGLCKSWEKCSPRIEVAQKPLRLKGSRLRGSLVASPRGHMVSLGPRRVPVHCRAS